MTREEAIEAIKCNWPDSRYTILREALDMAISALRQQEHFREVTKKMEPLTMDELRNSAGSWVWVVVNYEHCKCDGWALVQTPAYVAFLDQTIPTDFYGKKFVAYRQKPEEG